MLIEKEELTNLCPSYQKLIEEFEAEYSAIPEDDIKARKKLLNEFSQNYLMLPCFWNAYFHENHYCEIGRTRARKQFYCNGDGLLCGHGFKKLWHEPASIRYEPVNGYDEIKNEINPQKYLQNAWISFKEYSYYPFPKEALLLYQNSAKLYEKIKAIEKDDFEKWFNLITQAEDVEYVCSNIEYRIGGDLNNIKLWKLYINYLKENDTKRLLHVYSCYCRYFIDDVQMKDEYKKSSQTYGPSLVSWKNLFAFETFIEEVIDYEIFENDPKELIGYERDPDAPLICKPKMKNTEKISFQNCQNQLFSLPKTIMSYIIDQFENLAVLHKFHQTCKYFFVILPYPVCHHLKVSSEYQAKKINHLEFHIYSVEVSYNPDQGAPVEEDFVLGKKCIISNTFHFCHQQRKKVTMLSKFLPNIFQCNAKYIRIFFQNFTFKELQFLIGHGSVELLHLYDCNAGNKDETELEKVLKLTPKILEFWISWPKITPQTFEILADMEFKNKFSYFWFRSINYLEPYGFTKFLKPNVDSNTVFHVTYNDKSDKPATDDAISIAEKELKDYWPRNDGPNIYLRGDHKEFHLNPPYKF